MSVRPAYETPDDRVTEAGIAVTLGRIWRCDLRKLPNAYNLDYAAVRGSELLAWLEIKRRNRERLQYPTVFLSMQKVMAAHNLSAVTGKPSFFVVQFNDCLAFARVTANGPIDFRGRTDRGDWQDQEPVTVIDSQDFKIIHREET